MKTRVLFAAFSLVTMMTLVSCGTEIDKDGIFKDIEKEIELKDAVVKGNIFDIREYNGKLYAGGGKVYVTGKLDSSGGWSVLYNCPLSDGVVVRMDIDTTGKMTVQCRSGGADGENRYYWRNLSGGPWTSIGSFTFPSLKPFSAPSGQPITCSYAAGGKKYYGTTTGAYYSTGGTHWAKLLGSNFDATIGGFEISAIYVTTNDTIYVGTIGTGPVNATKKNGLWAYYGDTWNRE